MAQLNLLDTVVMLNQVNGVALIPKPTPLTRLNYYDGKYLRAADMQAEQEYLRRLQQFSNQASGAGVVHGFDVSSLAGDQLQLSAGLAIDNEGRVLFMPQEAAVGIEDLIARSRNQLSIHMNHTNLTGGTEFFSLCEVVDTTVPVTPIAGVNLYVVGISRAEALCGQEDVYGKLCEEACVSGTERPYRLEGVVLRALPLVLNTPLPTSSAVQMEQIHLRSRVASAYFGDEGKQIGHLISAAGLQSNIWCNGALASSGGFVPLGVIGRAGGHTVLLDSWTARRERVDGHPRRYWQWRMMMRPWDVYLAQILQFQCQLRDAWQDTPPTGDDPCDKLKRTVLEVSDLISQLERQYQATSAKLATGMSDSKSGLSQTLLASMTNSIQKVKGSFTLLPKDRVLIRRGIVELPSAGYLPVAPGSAISVNDQVRNLLGEGVDLRFCVVRPDYVAEALQEAQHMERISLLRGLDNPQAKEEVDILVPDGEIAGSQSKANVGWEVRFTRATDNFGGKLGSAASAAPQSLQLLRASALSINTNTGAAQDTGTINTGPRDTGMSTTGSATQPYARDVMTGAGRSEMLEDGSCAFHFAGLVETASRDAAVADLKKWAAERDNNLEQTLWRSMDIMTGADAVAQAPSSAKPAAKAAAAKARTAKTTASAKAATDTSSPNIAANYSSLRQQAVDYRMKTIERVATRGTSSGINHFVGLKDDTSDHVGLWLSVHTQANPLIVEQGGRIGMGMNLSVIMPKSGGTHFIDIDIVGAEMTVESRVSSGQRMAVQGTLKGSAIIRGAVGTLANAQRGISFSVPVIIMAEPDADGMQIQVEVDFSNTLFDGTGILGLERVGVRVLTRSQPQSAKMVISIGAGGTQLAFAASLLRNDAVLNLGHPLREAAETAIEVLATRESAPNFASEATADLFGQKPAPQDALTVYAKRDWVLFHRRRTKQCGAGQATQTQDDRRYQIHHLRVKTTDQLRAARAAVIGADVDKIRKLGFAPIGAAAFEGGRSGLTTPTTALLADWDAANPGNRIKFGAIGSQGAAQGEGDALAKARLSTLELTLSRGDPGSIENQTLPVLPALNLGGWDGAIFLVSIDEKTISHDVYRVQGVDALGELVKYAQGAGLKAALANFQLQPFTKADFDTEGKTLLPESVLKLREAWGTAGKPWDDAMGYYQGASANPTQAAQTLIQSQAIMAALDGNVSDVRVSNIGDLNQVTDSDGVTVLIVDTPVSTKKVLMVFAPIVQGVFSITATTNAFSHDFSGSVPTDMDFFVDRVKNFLGQKPVSVTVASHTAADEPVAKDILETVDEVLQKLGDTQVVLKRTKVLDFTEVNSLAARNFPEDDYTAVVFFSPTRV